MVVSDEGISMGVAGARAAHRGHGKSGGVVAVDVAARLRQRRSLLL